MPAYIYIWEFEVRPGKEAEFEREYGPEGMWVRLFQGAPGYRETSLLRDPIHPRRYLTIDRWESEAAYQAFRAAHAREYAAIDAKCEGLTVAEREVGHFTATT